MSEEQDNLIEFSYCVKCRAQTGLKNCWVEHSKKHYRIQGRCTKCNITLKNRFITKAQYDKFKELENKNKPPVIQENEEPATATQENEKLVTLQNENEEILTLQVENEDVEMDQN